MVRRWSLSVVAAVIVCGGWSGSALGGVISPASGSRLHNIACYEDSGNAFECRKVAFSENVAVRHNPGPNKSLSLNRQEPHFVFTKRALSNLRCNQSFVAGEKLSFGWNGRFYSAVESNLGIIDSRSKQREAYEGCNFIRRGLSSMANFDDKLGYLPKYNIPDFNFTEPDIWAELKGRKILRNAVGFPHCIGSFASVFNSFAREGDLPQQEAGPDNGDPDTPLCPKCAIFSSLSSAPLGAKIAFALPFWLVAWGAILEGVGVGLSRRRRFNLLWLLGGVAIGLIPLFLGIV